MIISKKIVLLTTLVLLAINIYAVGNFSLLESSLVRLVSLIIYFVVFIKHKGLKNKAITYVFSVFILVVILSDFYNYTIVNKFISIVKISAYSILGLSVASKLSFTKTKKVFLFLFSVIVLLNLFFLIKLILWKSIDQLNDNIEFVLYILYALVLVCLGTVAVNYNMRYNTKRSIYFLGLIFCLIFSDLTWFIANFTEYYTFFYADVVFYIIAIYNMFCYTIYSDDTEDQNIEKLLLSEDD